MEISPRSCVNPSIGRPCSSTSTLPCVETLLVSEPLRNNVANSEKHRNRIVKTVHRMSKFDDTLPPCAPRNNALRVWGHFFCPMVQFRSIERAATSLFERVRTESHYPSPAQLVTEPRSLPATVSSSIAAAARPPARQNTARPGFGSVLCRPGTAGGGVTYLEQPSPKIQGKSLVCPARSHRRGKT